MKVQVLYFAKLRELLDCSEEEIEIDDLATIDDLLAKLATRKNWDKVQTEILMIRAALNQEFVDTNAKLHDGCEVALFPPVTGG